MLLVAFTLFRPGYWVDQVVEPYQSSQPAELAQTLATLDEGSVLRMRISGEDSVGKMRDFSVLFEVPAGETGQDRLDALGIATYQQGQDTLIDVVGFASPAEAAGLQFDQQIVDVRVPVERFAKEWMWIPALLLFGLVVLMQRRRLANQAALESAQTKAA
ncbi:TRAP-type uncharacterized transport system [Vibrio ponticus]|nr:TRAP-type uncharacterized transport system [Vibrio ponticus]